MLSLERTAWSPRVLPNAVVVSDQQTSDQYNWTFGEVPNFEARVHRLNPSANVRRLNSSQNIKASYHIVPTES